MYGKIIRIAEVTDVQLGMDGYEAVTDGDADIHVMISNGQSCCESWGYFTSEDDLTQFIGAELREVNLVDTALDVRRIKEVDDYLKEDDIQFVNFETNKGTFQLAVYNRHNGYYGHNIVVRVGNKTLCDSSL